MDMSNATAAGPSRGLLDMIFGSNQGAEEAEADGQGFGNLMNLIKVLNMKRESGESGAEAGRTLGETMLGKNAADGGVVGMPGMSNAPTITEGPQALMQSLEQEQRERMQRLAALGIPASALVQVPAQSAQLEGVQPEQVNQILRQKSLSPLSPQEMKLLQGVNDKIAQTNGQAASGIEVPAAMLAGGAANDLGALAPQGAAVPKAANPNGPQMIDPQLQKAMAAKNLDPRKLKAAEATVSGAPENMLTTEAYLQMHDSVNAAAANNVAKPQAKDPLVQGPQLNGADNTAAVKPDAALTAGAVAGASAKGSGLSLRKDDGLGVLPEGTKATKLDAAGAGAFGGALLSHAEGTRYDVYLPGPDKPEQRANMLLAEIGTGVSFHAHKGGGEMRLVIHPDDLGEVKLKIGTKNGKVEVQVLAENENVAKMIRGGSKELEASLKDQNLALAKFEVSVADATNVVATDTKSGLNEQLLSQNPQHNGGAFSQGSLGDEGRNARWGSESNARQGGGYSSRSEESARGTANRSARSAPQTMTRAVSGSGRLDVVA